MNFQTKGSTDIGRYDADIVFWHSECSSEDGLDHMRNLAAGMNSQPLRAGIIVGE